VKLLLFCLLVDLTKRARRRALIAQAWVELLALYVQGALPRREPETFAEAFERRRPR